MYGFGKGTAPKISEVKLLTAKNLGAGSDISCNQVDSVAMTALNLQLTSEP